MKFNLVFRRCKDLEFSKILPAAQIKKDKGPVFTLQFSGPEDKKLFTLEEFSEDKDQIKVSFTQGDKTLAGLVPGKGLSQLKETIGGHWLLRHLRRKNQRLGNRILTYRNCKGASLKK